MRNPWSPVNTSPQPSLFQLSASAVTLQALVDIGECTVVFAVQTVDPIGHELVALWSTGPLPLEDLGDGQRTAYREFCRQLWDATGPFADSYTGLSN